MESIAAVAPLRQGVACRPDDVDLQYTLGEVLLELGQDREAKTYLDNVRRIDPKDERPRGLIPWWRGGTRRSRPG